jgi:uncharacterized protein (DUF736 family)
MKWKFTPAAPRHSEEIMAFEQKDNSGALFKNERKEQPNHPDYTGKALIEGVEYWVSAWVKEMKDGRKYFSMAYKPKEENAPQRGRAPQARSAPERSGGSRSSRWEDSEETLPF